MPVDSQVTDFTSQFPQNFCTDRTNECDGHHDSALESESFSDMKTGYMLGQSEDETDSNIVNSNGQIFDQCLASVRPKIFPSRNSEHHKNIQMFQPNKWRRMIGFLVSDNELQSALFPRKLKKHRFAQAKRNLNHLYSYFSVKIVKCEKNSNIIIGLSRNDFPSTSELGKGLGSVAYNGGCGQIFCPHEEPILGPEFSKGDVVGCGILYPPHYRRYVDLSTDDSSDGMTDVVLTSLLNVNKKSMDFVQGVLGLKHTKCDSSSSEEEFGGDKDYIAEESDYFNENYVESHTKVEVYFTLNMQIVGKVSTCIPVAGFYPTIQVLSSGEDWLQFDFS